MSTKENDIYEENRKEEIISNMTREQEEILSDIHAKQADGVLDDDMPDDFERWIEDVSVDDLIKYLNLK